MIAIATATRNAIRFAREEKLIVGLIAATIIALVGFVVATAMQSDACARDGGTMVQTGSVAVTTNMGNGVYVTNELPTYTCM